MRAKGRATTTHIRGLDRDLGNMLMVMQEVEKRLQQMEKAQSDEGGMEVMRAARKLAGGMCGIHVEMVIPWCNV